MLSPSIEVADANSDAEVNGVNITEDSHSVLGSHRNTRVAREVLEHAVVIVGAGAEALLIRFTPHLPIGEHAGEASVAIEPTNFRPIYLIRPRWALTVIVCSTRAGDTIDSCSASPRSIDRAAGRRPCRGGQSQPDLKQPSTILIPCDLNEDEDEAVELRRLVFV